MELTPLAVHAAAFLFSVALKTVPIFIVAGLACFVLRRASAASRHLLWAVTLVSLLCLPVFCVLLPPLAAPVLPALFLPAPQQHRAVVADHVPQVQASIASPSQPAATPSSEANFVPAPEASLLPADDKAAANSVSPRVFAQKFNANEGKTAPAVPTQTQPVPSLSESKTALSAAAPKLTGTEWLLAVWLIGMTLVLSRMMLGLLGAERLVRQSVAVTSGPLAEAADEARRKLGLKARPSIRDGFLVAVPMTFGMVRSIVLVPAGAQAWPAERLEAVLLHEMGHIKRGDWLTAMLGEVICALYWFHPLVWLAARQMRTESEQACDDLVLTSGIPPAEYAGHLLEIVRGLTGRRGSMPAVVTMACKQDIAARIKTILATSKNRSAATGRGLGLATLAAFIIILPLAAMCPTPHQSSRAVVQVSPLLKVTLPDGNQKRLLSADPTAGSGPNWTPTWAQSGKAVSGPQGALQANRTQGSTNHGGQRFTANFNLSSKQIRQKTDVTPQIKPQVALTRSDTRTPTVHQVAPIQRQISQPVNQTASTSQFASEKKSEKVANPSVTEVEQRAFQSKKLAQVSEAQEQLHQAEEQYQTGIGTVDSMNKAIVALVEAQYAAANALLAPATIDPSIVQAKERLRRVTEGYQAKKNTSVDVDQATISLLDACRHQIVPSAKSDNVLQDLELADDKRSEDFRLAVMNFQAGKGTSLELQKASAALSDAHSRLTLYQAVTLAQNYVDSTRAAYQQGATSYQNVTKAIAVLEYVQARQTPFSINPGPATLAADVAAAQENLRLTEAMFQNGIGNTLDVDKARAALLHAQANQLGTSGNAEQAAQAADVTVAQEQLRRAQILYQSGAGTASYVDKARADLEKARGEVGK